MKLISWNVNGIRAGLKKGFWEKIEELDPDILAIQETKADDSIMSGDVLEHPEYNLNWHSNQERKGYCGVATLSKIKPLDYSTGFGKEIFDVEGRVICTKYKEFTLFNIYFPNGGKGPERVKYKLEFYDECLRLCEELRAKGEKLVVCGDYNTAHQEIDLHNPDKSHKTTGFLPEERAWLDKFVAHGYIDTFRELNPDTLDVYTWWDMKTRSRERNKGWRIDYFFITPDLRDNLVSADVLSDVMGSDHCPLSIELKF